MNAATQHARTAEKGMGMTVYLDHGATVPMVPEAVAAYVGALEIVGNPSSIHSQGQNARRLLEEAREVIAGSVGADPVEVTLTSGGTEAINLAIKGLFWARQETGADGAPRTLSRRRILATRAEHHATIDALVWLEEHEGAIIDWVPVSDTGVLDTKYLAALLASDNADDVALVTTLWANNEVGSMQPIDEIVAIAGLHGVPVHVDAVSAYGYVSLDFHSSGVAAMSLSAHKIGGPVSMGALVIARTASVTPLIHGGSQQRARSGTMDAAGTASFAAAAAALHHDTSGLRRLRNRLVSGVTAAVPLAVLRGEPVDRLPGNAHFTFPGCEGDSLLFLLDAAGFSVSTGSACQAGVPEASHVLVAMGLDERTARGALRVTLGYSSTEAEVDAFVSALPAAFERARVAGHADRATGATLRGR